MHGLRYWRPQCFGVGVGLSKLLRRGRRCVTPFDLAAALEHASDKSNDGVVDCFSETLLWRCYSLTGCYEQRSTFDCKVPGRCRVVRRQRTISDRRQR